VSFSSVVPLACYLLLTRTLWFHSAASEFLHDDSPALLPACYLLLMEAHGFTQQSVSFSVIIFRFIPGFLPVANENLVVGSNSK
jgi:hypothetical protein